MDRFRLDGKVALVTGTSKGMGRSIALALGEAGADVIGIVRSGSEQTASLMYEKGYSYTEIIADLSDTESLPAAAEKSLELYGRVDILVNNAGIIAISPAEIHSIEDYDRVMDVNAKAMLILCQSIGRHMLERGKGKIINTSSIHGFGGGFDCIAYTMSKHAVIGLTKALSNEWSGRGINVNAIAPGYTITDNTKGLREDEEAVSTIDGRIPMHRWATPEDIASVVVFLAGSASDYITGQTLIIDGGLANT